MAEAPAGRLLPGDRLPDVRLRDADGGVQRLHADFAGRPIWMVRPSAIESLALLPDVPPGVAALCVEAAAQPALPSGWRGMAADPRWLDLFDADVLLRIDANLRVQSGHALPLSQSLSAPEPVGILDAASLRQVAPVLQIPQVFEPELCAALIAHFQGDCAGGEASRVMVIEAGTQVAQLDPTIKQRRESLPRDPALEARMHERLMRRALPEIARVFNFQVGRRDAFKLLAYPEGAGYFGAHRDNDTPDVAHRRFALSINLNQGGYAGGEFRFPEFGPQPYSLPTGSALVFSCSLLHEVLPVERGTRYAVTTFLS